MPNGAYYTCGKYTVYENQPELDYEQSFVFDTATGTLVAWKGGGGGGSVRCKHGYRTAWHTSPPGFIFPAQASCTRIVGEGDASAE